jgi:hypothetical protein
MAFQAQTDTLKRWNTIRLSSRYQDPQKNPAKVLDDNEEGMVRSFLQQGSARTRPKETKPVVKKMTTMWAKADGGRI